MPPPKSKIENPKWAWIGIKAAVFTLIAPVTVAVWVPMWLLGRPLPWPGSPLRWLALVPIAMGTALYLWCVGAFAAFGRGTPAPFDPPQEMVARGAYRWVRNPMYLGVLTVLLGEGLLFGSSILLGYTLLAMAVCHLFILAYEEPVLGRKFGEAYERYKAEVPRWIPRRP